jgi:hypothetical protein
MHQGTIGQLARCFPQPEPAMTSVDILVLQPIIALIFGVLILIFPKLLNYLIAIYLIFIGVVGLWPHFFATPAT